MHGNPLIYVAAFLVALGVLIVFHELGHFLAARACGIKVLRFSLGFGKPLLTRRWGRDNTEWSLAAFPLGGYVKMLDEREGDVPPEDAHRAFNRQGVGVRMLVVVAGPLANFILAILIYWGVFFTGVQELRPILAAPPAASAAAQSGILEGERVRAVDGDVVATWGELRWAVLKAGVDRRVVVLEVINRASEIAFRNLETSGVSFDGAGDGDADPMRGLGLMPFRPLLPPVIGQVSPGSVAESAGLKPGDRFLSIGGQQIGHWGDVRKAIAASPETELAVSVERNGTALDLRLTPASQTEKGKRTGMIGVAAKTDESWKNEMFADVSYGPWHSLQKAVMQTWDTSAFSLAMIGRMLTGELSWRNLSGPVTIADYAGQSAQMGASHYLRFLALISISLGVLNLLPIPVLDGGHLLYYSAEIIKGGPLSERAMEIGQQIGLVILGLLMAFAFYNDIYRLVSG